MPLHVSSTCAQHQEVKIALHSLWYHHTYRCDDTRGCVMQFWPPHDEHKCSKHVEASNKLVVKRKFCVSSWLITEMNILRCTVSKTSKFSTVPRKVLTLRLTTAFKQVSSQSPSHPAVSKRIHPCPTILFFFSSKPRSPKESISLF